MGTKAKRSNVEEMEKAAALVETEKLLEELINEDPRLKAAQKQARYLGKENDSIDEEPLQIYRQRLRE